MSPTWKYVLALGLLALVIICTLNTSALVFRLWGMRAPRPVLDRYPMVTIVRCCKGAKDDLQVNLTRAFNLSYAGRIEFVFVVDSPDDAAVETIRRAISSLAASESRSARLVFAGESWHNAQKIHNMLCGVMNSSAESEYVLFVDDDVYIFPGLIEEMLAPLEGSKGRVLVSTGYEFISPAKGASPWTYALLTYRMHNLWSFSTTRPILCWGGCWMSPLWVFRKNYANVVDCYVDGGYSDDSIVSYMAQERGHRCGHPARAILPSVQDVGFGRYWDFVRRQFFVMDTWSSSFGKSMMRSLAFLIVTSVWLMAIWMLVLELIGFATLLSGCRGLNTVRIQGLVSLPLWLLMIISIREMHRVMTWTANSTRPPEQRVEFCVSWLGVWFGLSAHAILLPFAVLSVVLRDSIVWAGIRYIVRNGKVWRVERRDAGGQWFSQPADDSIAAQLADPRLKTMVSGRLRPAGFVAEL